MSTKVKLKKSSIVGRVPSVNDLDYGEIAINYADGRIYYKSSSNSINYFQDFNNALAGFDSADVFGIIDSAYIQNRQNLEYSSLIGIPTSFTPNGVDSSATFALIDSDYIATRANLAFAGTADITNYQFVADSGDITFTGTDVNGLTLSFNNQLVQVYLNGILLLENDDYTKSNNNTIILSRPVDSGDQLIVSDFNAFFTNQTVTANTIHGFIDSALASVGEADITAFEFTADSGQTAFSGIDNNGATLSLDPTGVQVYLNGILLSGASDYTVSANTLTLTDGASLNSHLSVQSFKRYFNFVGLDSADITGIVDATYIQANQTAQDFAYASLTGVPTTFAPIGVDSASTIALIDSAYIAARTPEVVATDLSDYRTETQIKTLIDSGVNAVIDAAPGALDTLNELAAALGDDANFSTTITNQIATKIDSAGVVGIVDAAYVQSRQTPQDFAYSSLTGTPNVLDSADITNVVDATYIQANQTAQDFAYASLTGTPNVLDSADITNVIDVAYIQANQTPQDFAYSSLSGAPNVLDSADIAAIATAAGGVDSAAIEAMIDSNYVASRVSLAYAGNAEVKNYKFVADSAQTVFTGVDENAVTLGFTNQLVQVYLNGVLLLDSDDYTKSNNNTITLVTPANLGDQLIVSDFKSFFASAGLDSADITNVIDATYIQANQTPQDFAYSSLTGAPNVLDSANVSTLITTAVDALVDGAPGALDTLNELATALNDDSNAIAAINNTLALKLNIADVVPQDFAYSSLTGVPTTFAPTGVDSGSTLSLINAAYIQANQTPQDFTYSSLTGAPNVLDSADVTAIATAAGGVDSAAIEAMIDSNYVASRVTLAYAGNAEVKNYKFVADSAQTIFTGADENAVTLGFTNQLVQVYLNGVLLLDSDDYAKSNNDTITLVTPANLGDQLIISDFKSFFASAGLDSADITNVIDATYIQANQTAQDFAYSSLTGAPNILDSADVLAIAPAQDFAYSSLTGTPNVLDSADVLALAPAQDFAYSSLTGTPTTIAGYGITDAFDGAYSSLTGTPNVLDSSDVTAIATAAGGVDSAAIEAMIDSNYVASRVTLAYAGNAEVKNYKFIADSNQTIFTGADENAVTLGFTNQLVQVYLNGVLLLDGDDYTKSNNNTITLTQGASVGDQLIVSDFKSFFASAGLDSADITNVIDATYIQANQTAQDFAYSSLTGAPNVLDSNNVSALITTSIDNLIDGAPGALDTLNELATALNDDSNAIAAINNTLALKLNIADVTPQDFSYASLTGVPTTFAPTGVDSGSTLSLINAAYIQANQTPQDFAYSSLTGVPTTFAPTGVDSGSTLSLINAAYIQANQTPQDFAYVSLTGAPNVLDSADVLTIANAAGGVDSAAIEAMIDSNYVASRVTLAYAGNAQVQNTKFIADSNQTIFTGLSYADQLVQVYLNGVLLLDSDDYTKSGNDTITLTQPADLDDQLIVSDFNAFFTNQTVDSAQINSLIDSALGTVGRATVKNYKFIADSGDITFTGTDANGLSLSYNSQLVQVYLNGLLLTESTDYTKSGNDTITLISAADSGDELSIVDFNSFFTYSGFDSADVLALQTPQDFAYSSLTGTPNILDSADVLALAPAQDFAYSSLTGAPNVLDSADVLALAPAQDFAYSSLTGAPNVLDSADVLALQTPQDFAYASLTGTPNILDSANVLAIVPAQDFAYASLTGAPNVLDSANVSTLITTAVDALVDGAPGALNTLNELAIALNDDSNAIAAINNTLALKLNIADVTPQDFAYSSLTGAPNVLDSGDVLAIATAIGGVDSAAIEAMIDSNYVASRVSLAYAGNAQVQNTKFIADSAQTVFTGLSYADQFVQVYLNGVLLLDSDDYTKSGNDTITLITGAASGDQLIVSDFKAFFTNQTVDSAQINSLIDSALGSVGRATVTNYKFVADSGDTIFTGTDINGLSLSYNNQLVQVYLNGLLLTESTDYTKTGSDTITLVGGADSGDELSIVDFNSFFTYNGFDSAGITSIINASYIQANQTAQDFAYSSLTGTPNILDSADVLSLSLDASEVTSLVDSAYVQARQTPQDFAYSSLTGTPTTIAGYGITDAFDGAYSSLTGTPNVLDSADIINVIDATYIQANQTPQDFAYSSLTGTPNVLDSADVLALAPAQDFAYSSLTGAPNVLDSADVLALAPAQDFAYSSLTGTPNVLDSADVLAIANAAGGVDSAAIEAMIDSNYVASRVSLAYAGNASVQNYKFIADSGQTAFTGLSYSDQFVQVYLNGVLLLDSDDYTKSGNDTITLITGAASGDQLIVSDFTSFFTNQTVDSAQINSLIDSALDNVGRATVTNYKFIADSAQTTFTGIDANGLSLSYSNQLVQVYLNGILLLDNDDYTKSGNNTITLTDTADSGDQLIIADYKSFFTSSGFDSAGILSFIDQDYIRNNQTTYASLSEFNNDTKFLDSNTVTNVIDAAYIQANQTAQDFAYSSLTGAPSIPSVLTDLNITDGNANSILTTDGAGNFSFKDSATLDTLVVNNLTVTGTQTTVDATTLTVEDPIIHLATSNENTDAIDIGFVGHYSDDGGSTKNHTGLIRDASNQEYYLFESLVQASLDSADPSLTVNVGGTNWSLATFNTGSIKANSISINGEAIDSAYVQARQTAQDFAYSSLTGAPNVLDSADVLALAPAQDFAYSSLTGTPTTIAGYGITDAFDGAYSSLTGAPNVLDSADILAITFDGAYSSLTGTPNVLDSADVLAIAGGSGLGDGLDSAAAINIIDSKILQLDIGDIVGTDGNPGEVLQSNGNGNSSWTDIKLIAKQKAFAMSLIFG